VPQALETQRPCLLSSSKNTSSAAYASQSSPATEITKKRSGSICQHLPVLSSSQRCAHWFCQACILREQQRVAEENNGKVPKWIKCMHCRETTSDILHNPVEPKCHRLLIDLLGWPCAEICSGPGEMDDGEEIIAIADAQLGSGRATSMKIESKSWRWRRAWGETILIDAAISFACSGERKASWMWWWFFRWASTRGWLFCFWELTSSVGYQCRLYWWPVRWRHKN